MVAKFFSTVIEEEKETFDVEDQALKIGARMLLMYHGKKCIGKNSSHLDYNSPQIRCAYLYRYAAINTGLVTKYFRKMTKRKEIKNALLRKKDIKICSLGGGPGIDIVGVFKALAVFPSFHKKISKVSVLDICEGWENSFNTIMTGLVTEKLDVPATFINNKFQREFVKVDLLDSIPHDIKEIISNADIICIVRFVSVISEDKRAREALQVMGNLLKVGAFVLYIDTFNEKVFDLAEDIFKNAGLRTTFGPFHEKFCRLSKSDKDVFNCMPQLAAKFSVIGWTKATTIVDRINNVADETYSLNSFNGDNDWDTESEDLNISIATSSSGTENDLFSNEPILDRLCDKYTQTESSNFKRNRSEDDESNQTEDLPALLEALSDLLHIIEKRRKQRIMEEQSIINQLCCCCNHYCEV